MKTYIAGKITGDPDYRDKFNRAAVYLDSRGFGPILSPTILPQGLEQGDYMRICLAMLDSADVVAFLPDWEDSKGATIEHGYCQYASKQTLYIDSDLQQDK